MDVAKNLANTYQGSAVPPNHTLKTPTGSITPHILLCVAQLVTLLSPSFRGRRLISASAIAGLAILSQIDPYFTNDMGLAQPFAIAWANWMSTLEKVLFSASPGPEASLWRVDHIQGEALEYAAFSWQKLRWAIPILINMRGVRWNYQVKNVPPVHERRRGRFLLYQIGNLIWYMFMADLMALLTIRWLYTAPDGTIGGGNSKYYSLGHSDWRWSFAKALIFGASPYYMLSMQYTVFSVLFTAIYVTKPEDWPPHFGPISSATTVRSFWGKYWHQTIRKLVNAYTTEFCKFLGIPRGTNLSSYTQLYLAFAISAVFHANSMRGVPSPANIDPWTDLAPGWLKFFAWQAFAITLEDMVIWSWKTATGQDKDDEGRWYEWIVGYMWVTANIWFSLGWVGAVMLRMRIGEVNMLPFSFLGNYIEHVPIPP